VYNIYTHTHDMYTVKQEHIVCFAIADQGLCAANILQNDTFAGVTDLM